MKSKRFLSLAIVLSMLISMLPGMTAFALPAYLHSCTIKINAVDKNGETVENVVCSIDGETFAADGTTEHTISATYAGTSKTISVTDIPEQFKKVKDVTTKLSTDSDDDFVNTDYSVNSFSYHTTDAPDHPGSKQAEITYDLNLVLKDTEDYDFSLSIIDTNGCPVNNATLQLDDETTTSSSSISITNRDDDEEHTFAVTNISDEYITPSNVTFTINTLKSDFENAGYSNVSVEDKENNHKSVTTEYHLQKDLSHKHPVCGASCDGECIEGTHEDVEWVSLTQDTIGGGTLSGGNYVLDDDISTTTAVSVNGDVQLCLNGHTWAYTGSGTAITVAEGKTFTVTDCSESEDGHGNGEISSTAENPVILLDTATFKIYNGCVNNKYEGPTYHVNCVPVYGNGVSTAYLYGGKMQKDKGISAIYNVTYIHIGGSFEIGEKSYIVVKSPDAVSETPLLYIDSPLKNKYRMSFSCYGDFTVGWRENMGDECSISDYIEYCGSSSTNGIMRNPSTGELHYYSTYYMPNMVYIADCYGGSATVDPDFCRSGDTVTITATPDENKILEDVLVMNNSTRKAVPVVDAGENRRTFTMPNAPVTVNVSFCGVKFNVNLPESTEHGKLEIDKVQQSYEYRVEVKATPDEDYSCVDFEVKDSEGNSLETDFYYYGNTYSFYMPYSDVTVTARFIPSIQPLNISKNIEHGTVISDDTEAYIGNYVYLKVTPEDAYKLNTLTVTDEKGNEIETTKSDYAPFDLEDTEYYVFTMPAGPANIDATFVKKDSKDLFTVISDASWDTVDKDTDRDGVQVEAGDTVYVDVSVEGDAFTNADWTLVYDFSKFEYVSTTKVNDDGVYTLDETKKDNGVLKGRITAPAGKTDTDEFENGEVVVTYVFKALPQKKEATGTFKIEEAHANNYEMAAGNNTPAKTKSAEVTIILIDNSSNGGDEGETVTPIGNFETATKQYNANAQTGNEFVPEEKFASATITYAAAEDGKEKEELSYKTTLPSWKNVGTYTYYAKITGAGLATTYAETTLTITPAEITPSAMFKVDPDVNEVEFTPTLEGVLDGTHNGTVTVKYTDKNGDVQTVTLNASDFVYDGETTSVWNGKDQNSDNMTFAVPAQTSGTFTVTLDYTDGENDNYTGDENSVTVDVDKVFADSATVKALENSITSVFGYDSTAHSLKINDEAVADVTNGTWTYTVSDTNATVTNVGDDALVKVTFTDTTGNYNDVIVYAILKVTPANVKITVNNSNKVMNEDDPELTGTVKVVDEDGNEVTGVILFNTNGLYGEDNLEVSYEREAGEEVGTYDITASYAPNDNYTVTVENGKFEITAPVIDPENPEDAIVKVEVVDLSKGGTSDDDATPDYTANKRLILVYTDVDKLFYGYKVDDTTTEKMFDVTAAGYKYVDNDYEAGTFKEDEHEYKHVYGIVVDAIDTYEATEAYEKQYRDNVVFLSSNLEDAPVNIVYDGDINLSNTIDVNDYSMTNGIYNNQYARATYIKNILKADINGSKKVDTDDVAKVKGIYEAKNK